MGVPCIGVGGGLKLIVALLEHMRSKLLDKSCNQEKCTKHGGAARSAIEPEDERIIFGAALRGDEEIVVGDEGLFLDVEVAGVHFEFLAEIIVSVKFGDLLLGGS